MAALDTVDEYVAAARTLLVDETETYRYTDAELVLALSLAVLDARRIRPDLFLDRFDDIPSFVLADIAAETEVDIDIQYRSAFLYYIVGHAQLRDEEDTQDARASSFINTFETRLRAGLSRV